MMRLQILALACIATACTDPKPRGPMTGVTPAGITGPDDPNECGFDITDTNPDGSSRSEHVVFVHDAAGRVTSSYSDDGNGTRLYTEVNEFDAMGHVVHRSTTNPSWTSQTWMTWDAFGRELRWSRDRTGDGVEDSIHTFNWDDQQLLGFHDVETIAGVTTTDDETYHYDELGRLDGIDDVGAYPFTTAWTYDDVARVMNTAYHDATQDMTSVDAYDDHDRPMTSDTTTADAVTGAVMQTEHGTYEYPSAALTIWNDVSHVVGGDAPHGDYTTRWEYHYGNCPNARRGGDGVARQATHRAAHR